MKLFNDDRDDADGNDALVDLAWRRLQSVQRFYRSGDDGESFGKVTVSVGGDTLTQNESGRLAERRIACHNVWRWRRNGSGLHLAHLRYGEPVELVTLTAAGKKLTSNQPHRCGDDRYHLTLTPTAAGVTMHWRITGASKNSNLRVVYD